MKDTTGTIVRNRKWGWAALALSMVLTLFLSAMPVQAAGGSYITGVTVTDEENPAGYTVLEPGANLRAADEEYIKRSEEVYVAYRHGSEQDAITDLKISEKYSATGITVDGIQYRPASTMSLNENTEGTPIYLYYTKDAEAGDPIRTLTLACYRTDSQDVTYHDDPILNDGYIPVLTDVGEAANLEEGREDLYIYLEMLPKTIYRPYIKEVHTVCAYSRKDAITELASLGCDYFVDENQSEKPKYTYIGYKRTSEKSEAVTSLRAVKASELGEKTSFTDLGKNFTVPEKVNIGTEETLYLAASYDGDTPVYDIRDYGIKGGETITIAEFAETEFDSRITIHSYLGKDAAYKSALESQESVGIYFIPVVSGAHIHLNMVYGGGEAFTDEQYYAAEGENDDVDLEAEEEEESESTDTGEVVRDSVPDGTPEKEQEVNTEIDPEGSLATEDDTEEETEAEESESVFTTSLMISVVAILAGAILLVWMILTSKNRKKHENSGERK